MDDELENSELESPEKLLQFGRAVKIEILDFESKTKTTIGNDLEIEFSFFKTVDHVKEDDMGKVRVYGLTKERIKSFQESGGEIRVYAGYKRVEVPLVFWGYITRMYGEINENTTVLNIECSANMMNHFFTGVVAPDGHKLTNIGSYLNSLARGLGYGNAVVDLEDIPKNKQSMVEDFFNYYPANNVFVGDASTLVRRVAETYHFEINTSEVSGVRDFTVKVTNKSLNLIQKLTNKGYTRSVSSAGVETVFKTLQTADVFSNNAVILDRYSGLISSSVEYKIATAYADQELGSHEEETLESLGKSAEDLAAYVEREEERRRRIQGKGKEYQPRNVPSSLSERKVNRKYNKVKALFNPKVLPQGLVVVYDSFEGFYHVYRVRSMNISCNNRRNDWVMELDCEDATNLALTEEQIEQLKREEISRTAIEQSTQGTYDIGRTSNKKRDIAMQYFMSVGWSKAQAAGITANLQKESRFNHTALGDKNKKGVYLAYGIAQWHPDRQRDFRNAFGKNIRSSTYEEQLQFVHFEMTKGKEISAGRLLKSASSAYSAGSIVSEFYERPKKTEHEKSVRGKLAQAIYNIY